MLKCYIRGRHRKIKLQHLLCFRSHPQRSHQVPWIGSAYSCPVLFHMHPWYRSGYRDHFGQHLDNRLRSRFSHRQRRRSVLHRRFFLSYPGVMLSSHSLAERWSRLGWVFPFWCIANIRCLHILSLHVQFGYLNRKYDGSFWLCHDPLQPFHRFQRGVRLLLLKSLVLAVRYRHTSNSCWYIPWLVWSLVRLRYVIVLFLLWSFPVQIDNRLLICILKWLAFECAGGFPEGRPSWCLPALWWFWYVMEGFLRFLPLS